MSWEAANVPKRRRIVADEDHFGATAGAGVSAGENNFVGDDELGTSSSTGDGGTAATGGGSGLTNIHGSIRIFDNDNNNNINATRAAGTGTVSTTTNVVRKTSGETVEAALSRLSKAYSTAMECIGAAQRTDRLYMKKKTRTQITSSSTVANTSPTEPPSSSASASASASAAVFAAASQEGDQQNPKGINGTFGSISTTATSDDSMNSLKDVEGVQHRVVNAARTTLEESILVDPLIVPYVPTLQMTMVEEEEEAAAGGGETATTNRWTTLLNRKRHVIPPTINSSAHRAKIRELAYLSLVNYSDLLQTCGGIQSCDDDDDANRNDGNDGGMKGEMKSTILDRGITRRLSSIPKEGCWGVGGPQSSSSLDEAYITTQRLAVSALCDASALDGSDPVLWLKLACGSRRLENAISLHEKMTIGRPMVTTKRSKYRRLQKYALEQGLVALPSHMPPNKTIVRALDELDKEPEPAVYISDDFPSDHTSTHKRTLDLTRYSWLTLGRMILRSCRGDDMLSSDHRTRRVTGYHRQQQDLFGSPTIVIRMSPMISLPTRVIGNICGYLDDASIRGFEATCRSLSASIFASRDASAQSSGQQQGQYSSSPEDPKEDNDQCKDNPNISDSQQPEVGMSEVEEKNEEPVTTEKDSSVKRSKRKLRVEGQRSSKRVRSNEEKSGKKQERAKNRNSFEYCFTAATSGCTVQGHLSAVKQLMDGPTYNKLFDGTHLWNTATHGSSSLKKSVMGGKWTASELEACERISDSSLSKFIIQCSSRNSGPIDMLEKLVRHISLHVEDIFGTIEANSKAGLVSFLLQCIDMLATRSGFRHSLTGQFYLPVEKTGSTSRSIELFAMDVLHVELLLRQIDRTIPAVVDFDDNENTISIMIPHIVDAALTLESTVLTASPDGVECSSNIQSLLKSVVVRCYWVVAGYYFWRSKTETSLYVSKEAEEEGVCFVEKAINCFESPAFAPFKIVSTPHLVTPMREDPCWNELSLPSLVKFRNEVQASSVISDARQQFEELLVDRKRFLDEEPPSEDLPDDMVASFAAIGSKLYERYDSGYGDSKSKLSELIEDVISVHGNDLLYGDVVEQNRLRKVSQILSLDDANFSTFEEKRDYSILSMLVSCLSADSLNGMMLAKLMIRLILTTKDIYKSNLDHITELPLRDAAGTEDTLINTDADALIKHDKNYSLRYNDTVKRGRKYLSFVRVLIDSLLQLLNGRLSSSQQEQLISSDEFILAIYACCEMANLWFNPNRFHGSFHEDDVDRQVFVVTTTLMDFVKDRCGRRKAEITYFYGMVRTIVRHHDILESLLNKQVERSERSSLQRVCIQRARFLDPVLSNLGYLLSSYLSEVKSMTLKRGSLFEGPLTRDVCSTIGFSAVTDDELTIFLHSVQKLWKYSSQIEIESSGRTDTANVSSSFDRPIVKVLRIPVTIVIVGLCGSACQSRNFPPPSSSEEEREDPLSLIEIFDSDASCNGWESDGIAEEDSSREEARLKELLRVICHGINCVRLVLESVSDKDAVALALEPTTNSTMGPRLPLMASRVLNFYADTLLTVFHVDEPNKPAGKITYDPLWSEFYPFRTQDIGDILDGVLHKCYRWLHGFALVGETAHVQSSGKDLASTASDIPEILSKKFSVESTTAAAQLYRCIVRAYAGGRRTPPKSALELVKSALPSMEESERSAAIRRFIFDGTLSYFSLNDIQEIVRTAGDWKDKFSSIHDFICPTDSLMGPEASFEENEVMKIRRGLSKQLSSGPIPVDPTDLSSDDARVVMQQHEEEISKKFNYIIDDLCISDAGDVEGWYQASQCLTVKADVIADRLGYNKGFTRISNFSVPSHRSSKRCGIPIDDLETYQAAETKVDAWIEYLGTDLSLYVNHKWSSFESLQACKTSLEDTCPLIDDRLSQTHRLLRDIDRKFDEKKFVLWQEAWGGIFVAALRSMSLRCLGVALYILQTKESRSFPETIRAAEMCEAFGVAIYGNLMANQTYGYPMRSITTKEKRDIAVTAQVCFDVSIELVDTSTTQDDASDDRTTWDLDLMVGKCHEKIASTYRGEDYSKDSISDPRKPRRYADHMTIAIDAYKKALIQAKRIEDDGVQIVDQAGGSAHGSTEVLHRLHTARLKIHIEAVSRHESEIRAAEEEALQLTEKEWFIQPEELPEDQSIRDRVWVVFADIVAGLAECRRVQPFFHRSVFRHAQALMWSPVLHDPISSSGSKDTVPATRSVHIRGLNNSTSAAESAEAVIKTLFDKKRSQLAAVWITTTAASSPLQILNSTIRKYDSVRGKYIAAYIETLHLCDRRGEIETFMRWLYAAKMDLPAYFQASAKAGGEKPAKSQAHDSLLVIGGDESSIASQSLILSSKRQANSNLADVLIHEMSEAMSQSPSEYKKVAESFLKHSYASYLRLNCTPRDLKRVRAWRYGADTVREVEALCQAWANLGHNDANTEDFGEWSGGSRKSAIFDSALSRCRELYPTLSTTFFSKKSAPKSKKGTKEVENEV